jgi:hypothetical protein
MTVMHNEGFRTFNNIQRHFELEVEYIKMSHTIVFVAQAR